MYDRYQKARQGLNIEEAMVIKISALDVTGFAKLLRTVYIDENAAGDGYAVCLRHFPCTAGKQDSIFTKAVRIYIEDTPANGGIGCGTELPLL